MIVAEVGEEYELVTQGDHAALAAELLSLLRVAPLIEHPRRDLLLLATREHDRGWRGADAAPRVEPGSGRPIGYREMPSPSRREIWTRACEAMPSDDPYVRLLIVLHCLFLHRDRGGSGEWDDWLAGLRDLELELLEACELDREEAAADHAWLALADLCSLALCERLDQTFRWSGFVGAADGTTLRLSPFPLAGKTTFTVPHRRLRREPFASDGALGGALAAAHWSRRSVSVAPGDR